LEELDLILIKTSENLLEELVASESVPW
jgi:hypothetical protein